MVVTISCSPHSELAELNEDKLHDLTEPLTKTPWEVHTDMSESHCPRRWQQPGTGPRRMERSEIRRRGSVKYFSFDSSTWNYFQN